MKKLLIAAALIVAGPALAETHAFGLKIGKSTVDEARSTYRLTSVSHQSGYEWFHLEGAEADGLTNVLVIADGDSIIHGVVTQWRKSEFDVLLSKLTRQYKLLAKDIPANGDKSAVFVDGDVVIVLLSPQAKPNAGLIYGTSRMMDEGFSAPDLDTAPGRNQNSASSSSDAGSASYR